MPKAIIIEGPDGAGKSTLLKKLEQDLGREVAHGGGPPKDKVEWADRLMRIRDLMGRRVVLDRIPFISEQIYGPLYNRGPDYSLTRELLELDPVVVFCCLSSPMDMVGRIDRGHKGHKPSAHMELVLDHFPMIVRSYRELMLNLSCKGLQVLPYDWTRHDYNYLVQELKRCAG